MTIDWKILTKRSPAFRPFGQPARPHLRIYLFEDGYAVARDMAWKVFRHSLTERRQPAGVAFSEEDLDQSVSRWVNTPVPRDPWVMMSWLWMAVGSFGHFEITRARDPIGLFYWWANKARGYTQYYESALSVVEHQLNIKLNYGEQTVSALGFSRA